MTIMRGLPALRLSHDTDESTSEERQEEATVYTVKARGDRVAHICRDIDVSGAVSPFERPDLGPWLTEPDKIAQWDYIIVAKLDRLTRSLLDFQKLLQWCDAHGKTIISVSEGFDLGTKWGRLIANILIMFAEFERERIAERRAEAAEKLRREGKWNGGQIHYGYRAKDGGNGFLYQDPDTAPVRRRIAMDSIDGITDPAICRALMKEKIPTPQGGKEWRNTTIQALMESRALRGEAQYKGRSILDADGNPIMFTEEPILATEAEWNLLQLARKSRSRPHKGQRDTNHLYVRFVFCGECEGAPFYYHRESYRCSGKAHGMPYIRDEDLASLVEGQLLSDYGNAQIERRASVGKDYEAELTRARDALDELEEQYTSYGLSAERFNSVSTKMEARIKELEHLVKTAVGPSWEPAGETVRQRWERSDFDGRRLMLARLGVRWELRREYRVSDHAWRWQATALWDSEAHERLTRLPG